MRVPADDASRKKLARLPQGDTREFEYRERRNGAMHRRYWALCGLISQNVEGYASADMALWDCGEEGTDEPRLVAYGTQVFLFSFPPA